MKSANTNAARLPSGSMRASDPKLADFLCFAIYSANLAYRRAYKPILDELGLTYPQYIAIVALWEQDHQTVTGLGEKLFLESNTLTPMLKKLEAMGYLRRQRDPADERQVQVSLTDAGRRLREKGLGMNLVAASGLSPEEFPRMQKAVVALRDNLIKAAQGSPEFSSTSPARVET
jgi:MarR family transcriptional regulator, organic hydroperoxide resistance regulator